MRPCVIPQSIRVKTINQSNNTAFWIFDPAAKVPFRVNSPHFKARTGGMADPVMGLSKARYDDLGSQMVYLQDTVMSMVDYFMEGASLEIDPKTLTMVYDRIYNHIQAHLNAMQSNKSYDIGDTFSVFEDLVDFASSIFNTVDNYKSENKVTTNVADPFASMLSSRPTFMTMFTKDPRDQENNAETLQSDVKISPLVEMLERMRLYYNGGSGWG